MFQRLFWIYFLIILFEIPIQNSYGESKPGSTPLTLEEAVMATLEQNPEFQAMKKSAEAAHDKITQARSWDDPQIGVRFFQIPFNGPQDETSDIDYIVAQKIPFPGKKKAASQIVYHEYLHHLEEAGAKGRALLREVKTTYYDLFSVGHLLEQNRKIENTLRTLIRSTQAKLSAGQSLASDAALAQAELASILVARQPLLERQNSLKAKLIKLMARDPAQEFSLASQIEIPHWKTTTEELLEIAQLRHPSIKLADHDIDQKRWGVKAAKREYLPDLNAQLEYIQKPSNFPDAWTGEFMLNVPLLVNKKSKAVSEAQAELASAKYGMMAAKNEITYSVKENYAKMKAADEILDLSRGTVIPQTRQALEATAAAYSAGKIPFISYLSALRGYFEAQMNYWKAFASLASSVYELEEAVGATREELADLKSETKVQKLLRVEIKK